MSTPSEERFPLLLLVLEDERRSSNHVNKILFDKGRYRGVTQGASAVITQWPGHVTTCWLLASMTGLLLILLSLTIFTFSIYPDIFVLTARCKRHHYKDYDNETVHLIHGPHQWSQSELLALEQIGRSFAQSQIRLILIQKEIDVVNHTKQSSGNYNKTLPIIKENRTSQLQNKTTRNMKLIRRFRFIIKPNYRSTRKHPLSITIGDKNRLNFQNNIINESYVTKNVTPTPEKVKSLESIVNLYPNMKIINSTYAQIFKNTPMKSTWQNINETTRIFLIRVWQLWNFAGITFDLPDFLEKTTFLKAGLNTSISTSRTEDFQKFTDLITIGLSTFKHLPEGLVTIDDLGIHMETKTSCHAFFGDILLATKKVNNQTMPRDLIQKTLKKFCSKGAVDENYCRRLKIM